MGAQLALVHDITDTFRIIQSATYRRVWSTLRTVDEIEITNSIVLIQIRPRQLLDLYERLQGEV